MKNALKIAIKKAINFVGLDVRRFNFETNPGKQLDKTLAFMEIDLVLDIGANIGQYAKEIRANGYKGKIISFEPLPYEHAWISARSKYDELWSVYERGAIGSECGNLEINVSRNSYSSSLLPMLESHLNAAPESAYVDKISTPVFTLDSISNSLFKEGRNIFLKIDTQGYEFEVLKGASVSLKNINAVQIELSIIPLYKDQKTYEYFLEYFKRNGFNLWSLIPGFIDPRTGQTLQFDAIFARN